MERTHTSPQSSQWRIQDWFCDNNQVFLRSFIWASLLLKDPDLSMVLSRFAWRCYKKVPGVGAPSQALGTACCYVLSRMDDPVGVAFLTELKQKVQHASIRKTVEKFILEAAQRKGLTKYDLEDEVVQDYGLSGGKRQFQVGDFSAEINLPASGKPTLTWFKKDGSPLKSTPSAVKEQHSNELKTIKLTFDSLQKTLAAQRLRFDRMFLEDRNWRYDRFEKVLLRHGLLGNLVSRLIWVFEENGRQSQAMFHEGIWQTAAGEKLDWLTPQTTVRLWHPALHSADEVIAWREALLRWQVVQPFKQAFREIYLLTEAELNTRTYSNRMAAHIVRQHQLNSLATGRGWTYKLVGGFDGGGNQAVNFNIPSHGLRVEFWIDHLNDSTFSNSGIYNFVATDQVRFFRHGQREPMVLLDVLAVVLSEVMRDVDLFVGVASVGNDPTWHDQGDQRFQNYWQTYSFGNLGETAKTRKAILERLLPKLKIAKVAELRDKFLVIKGQRRTYKIHFGSTNILMEPNDQYLC
ncbi:MAG: DUF4132 domain-containing protein, partial [Bacteroidota bacterium]